MVRRLPKFASEFRDRHGVARVRFRRKGFATYYFRARFPSEDWWKEYHACMEGIAAPKVQPGADRIIPGSIADLIVRFYGSSAWQKPSVDTRNDYRLIIERFRVQLGDTVAAELRYEHADRIMQKMADRPTAANRLRKLMAQIWDEGLRIGMVDRNPWRLTKPLPIAGDGYRAWTEADVLAYEDRWPLGTRERLALALLLHTAQRRGDAIRLGPQHLRGGRLRFVQRKTGAAIDIPLKPELKAAIDAAPSGQMVFLVTGHGRPFTDAGFGNWFRAACDAAGLDVSAHGLRKRAAIRMAEAGATNAQIKAWTGHRTDSEVTRYIRDASQAKLADAGAAKMANLAARLAKSTPKPLKKGT